MSKKSTDTNAHDGAEPVDPDPIQFEAALEELEQLVGKMEGGELTLDESLKAFERGVTLTRQCQSALADAELKVQTLTKDGRLQDLGQDLDAKSLDDT